MITFDRAQEIVSYDPKTGIFRWEKPAHYFGSKGDIAGYTQKEPDNYVILGLDGRNYKAHRVAWLLMTGTWPDSSLAVDHIDRNPSNNAWPNLRLATPRQNRLNSRVMSNSTSGLKGAEKARRGRWAARITVDGVRIRLGQYGTPEEAHAAYRVAAVKYFGDRAGF